VFEGGGAARDYLMVEHHPIVADQHCWSGGRRLPEASVDVTLLTYFCLKVTVKEQDCEDPFADCASS